MAQGNSLYVKGTGLSLDNSLWIFYHMILTHCYTSGIWTGVKQIEMSFCVEVSNVPCLYDCQKTKNQKRT